MTDDPVQHLIELLGSEVVVTKPERLEAFRRDRSQDPGAGTPRAVVRARTTEQVQTTMRWATRHQVPVVPRGGGTSLAGGASALDGAIVLSLDLMSDIRIDPSTRTALVGPGAFNADVKRAAAEHGLTYPPDPSSYEISTIGGNVATNAGGLCCVKYGVTVDYVLGLDVVLADGRLLHLGGPLFKDVAGLPLMKLFVGSEGTLGIVTQVRLKLVPTLGVPATLVATFATAEAAAGAVVEICARTRPSMLELMDHATILAVEDYLHMGLDRSAGALLIAQSDARADARAAELHLIEAACRDHAPTELFVAEDPQEAEQFVAARRAVLPALEPLGELKIEDVGVPVPLLPKLIHGIEAIAAEFDVRLPTVAHAGDGNAHPVIVVDHSSPDGVQRAEAAFERIMQLAIDLGGTITGEHGVGRLKRAMLPAMVGEDVMEVHRRIKAAFDPDGLLNPGVGY